MKRALTFVDGIGVGIGAIAMLPILYFTAASDQLIAMYRDMGSTPIPAVSRLVFGTAWRIGVPLVLIAGWVAMLTWRPHRYAMIILAAATIAAVVVWYYGLYAPIFALAGNISG
jgi:hypothetical protein